MSAAEIFDDVEFSIINDALDIMHYQQLVSEKLEDCRERAGMDKCYSHKGIAVYLSRLNGILSGLDITWSRMLIIAGNQHLIRQNLNLP